MNAATLLATLTVAMRSFPRKTQDTPHATYTGRIIFLTCADRSPSACARVATSAIACCMSSPSALCSTIKLNKTKAKNSALS